MVRSLSITAGESGSDNELDLLSQILTRSSAHASHTTHHSSAFHRSIIAHALSTKPAPPKDETSLSSPSHPAPSLQSFLATTRCQSVVEVWDARLALGDP